MCLKFGFEDDLAIKFDNSGPPNGCSIENTIINWSCNTKICPTFLLNGVKVVAAYFIIVQFCIKMNRLYVPTPNNIT